MWQSHNFFFNFEWQMTILNEPGILGWQVFVVVVISALWVPHLFLFWRINDEKSAEIVMEAPLYMKNCGGFFEDFLLLFDFMQFDCNESQCGSIQIYSSWRSIHCFLFPILLVFFVFCCFDFSIMFFFVITTGFSLVVTKRLT